MAENVKNYVDYNGLEHFLSKLKDMYTNNDGAASTYTVAKANRAVYAGDEDSPITEAYLKKTDANSTYSTKTYVNSTFVPVTSTIAGLSLDNPVTAANLRNAINVANGSQANKIETVKVNGTALSIDSSKAVNIDISGKVDKVSGKGLSTNDYTTNEKNKLSGIASGAEVNQNAYSNVVVGSTTLAAGSKTGSFTLKAGSNVTINADSTNYTITITAQDTTYPDVTTSARGLMTASDKTKLNGIATNAQVNVIEGIKLNSSSNAITPSNKMIDLNLVPISNAEIDAICI